MQVDGVDRAAADRLGTLVLAGANTGHDPAYPLRVQTVHDEERQRMKIVILGGAAATADLLHLLDAVLAEGNGLLAGDGRRCLTWCSSATGCRCWSATRPGRRWPPCSDALDLIGAAFLGAEVVAVPASRLDDDFFSLGTRFAGEIMQKFVNYRLRLVVVGDISRAPRGQRGPARPGPRVEPRRARLVRPRPRRARRPAGRGPAAAPLIRPTSRR